MPSQHPGQRRSTLAQARASSTTRTGSGNLEVATELSYAVEGRRAAAEVGVDDAAGAGKPSPRPVGRLGGEACAVWTGGGHGRAGGVAGLAGDERASVAQEGVQTRELGWAVV
jgi:hypothetical protein